MTSKAVPRFCDFFCLGKEIKTEKIYKLQISERGVMGQGKKGKFVKANNDADMCQKCFIKICEGGYKPNWVTLVKDPTTDKWTVVEEN